ncbi:MAG: helix-turn-helix domain-containing protein [Candidatus Thorarchaeota archaeon]
METIQIHPLPQSSREIIRYISKNGPTSPQRLSEHCQIPMRTVSYALKRLRGQKLVRKVIDLQDMRSPRYHLMIGPKIVKQFLDLPPLRHYE